MALRLYETEPELVARARIVCSPTGDELPNMQEHWRRLEGLIGKPLEHITNDGRTLHDWIEHFNALPNPRMRWCTRLLKVQPFVAFLASLPKPVVQCVGLRADEPLRAGLFSDEFESRYPLREWGWGLEDVVGYLEEKGIEIPKRTDCARCPYQRLSEWHELWKAHPDIYEHAARQEDATGRTFRSPSRDTWPAGLRELGADFERGREPRGGWVDGTNSRACRVCSL